MSTIYQATTSAPVNIACIKYWGKRDTTLILPTNSSLSVTLSQNDLSSTTSSSTSPSFPTTLLWLNNLPPEQIDLPSLSSSTSPSAVADTRLTRCLLQLKKLRKELVEDKDPSAPKMSEWNLHIASYNNFPTAAGLASSASGFAALTASVAALYGLNTFSSEQEQGQGNDPLVSASQLSLIARLGSGSACRSLFGGFVSWSAGSLPSGTDSLATQIAPASHWPTLHALICIVNAQKKATSSTSGMQRTVQTSALLQHRITDVVPRRMEGIIGAIKDRDFDTFGRITMDDSNQFHAVALDTSPPIFYMNDVSRSIILLIEELNRVSLLTSRHLVAAYTFDAGPNAVIYAEEKHIPIIVNLVLRYFPLEPGTFEDRLGVLGGKDASQVGGGVPDGFDQGVVPGGFGLGTLKGLIHTRIGDGPRMLGKEKALLGEDGMPKSKVVG
ncbi:diphosphomevalonate decarboxylase [Lentinula raphanica]|nr:diphosphomevalonate decarboxylase [Lentinula raphanica]